jgi:hypothetical protein
VHRDPVGLHPVLATTLIYRIFRLMGAYLRGWPASCEQFQEAGRRE